MEVHSVHIKPVVWVKKEQRIVAMVEHDLLGIELREKGFKRAYLPWRKVFTGRRLYIFQGCLVFHCLAWRVLEHANL